MKTRFKVGDKVGLHPNISGVVVKVSSTDIYKEYYDIFWNDAKMIGTGTAEQCFLLEDPNELLKKNL